MNAVVYAPVVVRSQVPTLRYPEYREYLRADFYFSCAYCSIAEFEAAGIGFQIDHYAPQTHAPALVHAYSNLMWSCQHCNRAKSAVWPSTAQQAHGYRYVRPDADDPAEHFDVAAFRLVAKTTPGEFTLEVLFLNRPSLKTLRKARDRLKYSSEAIVAGLQRLSTVGLDRLKPEMRERFVKARRDAISQYENLSSIEVTKRVVKILNHSPLLDPDPSVSGKNARRREYLRKLGAIPDPEIVLENVDSDED